MTPKEIIYNQELIENILWNSRVDIFFIKDINDSKD